MQETVGVLYCSHCSDPMEPGLDSCGTAKGKGKGQNNLQENDGPSSENHPMLTALHRRERQ